MNPCTLHQCRDERGRLLVQGSELRLPTGEMVPGVSAVEISAHAGDKGEWEARVTLAIKFGEPITTKVNPAPG